MKCQKCDKQAAFHITDLTDDETVLSVHLCPSCAKEFLESDSQEPQEATAIVSMLSKQLKIGQTADQLAELDQKACPVCGITFFEFRKIGRLGCPNDYTHFGSELDPLIVNIHGETRHTGKIPKHSPVASEVQTLLIKLRREMNDAAINEDYELASKIRDEIRRLEKGESPAPATSENEGEGQEDTE